jgi:hypothetical protein
VSFCRNLWIFPLAGLALALSFCLSASAAESARINPRAVLVDSFDGWGTSLCWWAHVLGGSSNREAYADAAFTELQLNIVRYNIGGGENPDRPRSMELRARIPGFEPRPGVWDWSADANQRWFLRAAVIRGANQVVAFANSPPYWMTVSGSVTGSTNGWDDNLSRDYETAFAEYLVTVVRQLTALDGVRFNLLTPMNEPAAGWWKLGNRQEGAHMSPAQEERLINLLHPLLRQNGLPIGLEATEDNDEQNAVKSLKSYSPATWQHLAWLASHTYSANAPEALREVAATTSPCGSPSMAMAEGMASFSRAAFVMILPRLMPAPGFTGNLPSQTAIGASCAIAAAWTIPRLPALGNSSCCPNSPGSSGRAIKSSTPVIPIRSPPTMPADIVW